MSLRDPFNPPWAVPFDVIAHFGPWWCGPTELPHGEDVLVAKYDGGDEYTVEVYASAWPATFYTIKAVPAHGCDCKPFKLTTASGQHELAAQIAEAIYDGMLAGGAA